MNTNELCPHLHDRMASEITDWVIDNTDIDLAKYPSGFDEQFINHPEYPAFKQSLLEKYSTMECPICVEQDILEEDEEDTLEDEEQDVLEQQDIDDWLAQAQEEYESR